MFQYYDANTREYIDFDDETNDTLENSTNILIYKKIGDSLFLFDLSSMTQTDLKNSLRRKMRKI